MGKHHHEETYVGDPDLVVIVKDMLVENGLRREAENAYDDHRLICAARDKPSDVQRQLLNRFWAMQIHSCHDKDSLPLMSLIPDGNVRDWIALFRNDVLPFLVRNNLPVRI